MGYNGRAMAESHPLEEIVTRPGVYFNPQTEVLVVVFVVSLFEVLCARLRDAAGVAGVVMGLEGDEQLVAALLVDHDLL